MTATPNTFAMTTGTIASAMLSTCSYNVHAIKKYTLFTSTVLDVDRMWVGWMCLCVFGTNARAYLDDTVRQFKSETTMLWGDLAIFFSSP